MPKLTARTADIHDLYQRAVQAPDADVDFCRRLFKKRYGLAPTILREDFCGTALISCTWVRRDPRARAYGIDLHAPTLAWARQHNVGRLSAHQARRVHLLHQDVRHPKTPRADVVCALNFSYFVFKTLPALVHYFRRVRGSLNHRGLFVLDAYGGWESQQVMTERARHDEGFTYVWEQEIFNPLNDHTSTHIHFEFPDGTKIRRAFTYHWRLWSLAAIQDALALAGFHNITPYWEGDAPDGSGNGTYRPQKNAVNCPAWNAYITATP